MILNIAKFDLSVIDQEKDEGEKTVPVIAGKKILIGTLHILEAFREVKSVRLHNHKADKSSLYAKGEVTILKIGRADGTVMTYELYDSLEKIHFCMNH